MSLRSTWQQNYLPLHDSKCGAIGHSTPFLSHIGQLTQGCRTHQREETLIDFGLFREIAEEAEDNVGPLSWPVLETMWSCRVRFFLQKKIRGAVNQHCAIWCGEKTNGFVAKDLLVSTKDVPAVVGKGHELLTHRWASKMLAPAVHGGNSPLPSIFYSCLVNYQGDLAH